MAKIGELYIGMVIPPGENIIVYLPFLFGSIICFTWNKKIRGTVYRMIIACIWKNLCIFINKKRFMAIFIEKIL